MLSPSESLRSPKSPSSEVFATVLFLNGHRREGCLAVFRIDLSVELENIALPGAIVVGSGTGLLFGAAGHVLSDHYRPGRPERTR